MAVARVVVHLALVALVSGCTVGEVPLPGGTPDAGGGGGGNGGGNMDKGFTNTVAPLVTECTACHSAATPPNLSSFAALQAAYKTKPGAQNILVTKGALTAGTHQGVPYFTAAEQTTIAGWIDGL